MKRILFCLILCLFIVPQSDFQAYAQKSSVEVRANLRHAHHLFDKGDYEAAVSKLERVLSFDSNNAEARDLLNQCNQKLEQQRLARERTEQDAFNKAKQTGTKSALSQFLSQYPNSKYASQARGVIDDYDLWSTAVRLNTLESYNNYLRQSTSKSFEEEARAKIANIEAENEWQRIRNSNSLTELQSFVSKYPQSNHATAVTRRIHELKGEQYFNAGNLGYAYTEFCQAGGRSSLSYDNQQRFDRASDYNDYTRLNKYDESAMLSFLTMHPTSAYRNEVSNTIARLRANKLTAYSGEYSYNQALTYACDNKTRQYVQNKINESKRSYSQIKKAERSARIKANGGYVGIGIDIFDLDLNVLSSESGRSFNALHYNMALALRIGNFKTPVYLEVGVKPGLSVFKKNTDDSYYDYENDYYYLDKDNVLNRYAFHMPVFAKLKINLFKAWGNTKFYIDGIGYYNAIREEKYEPEFSVGGGIGVAGRHWDWQMLYYRQDIDKDKVFTKNDVRYWGMSLGYFF